MRTKPLYATAIGVLTKDDYKQMPNILADKVVDYDDYELLCNKVQEYLKYSSINGRAERQELREELNNLTKSNNETV